MRKPKIFLAALGLILVAVACPGTDPLGDGGLLDDGGFLEEDGGFFEEGCGDVTVEGSCTGDVLTYCDEEEEEVVETDCGDALAPRDATCIEVSDDYGSDCAVAIGEDCLLEDGTILFCDGTEAGCLDDVGGFACTANLGTCTEADEGTCEGELLLSVCAVNQPFVVDCESYGGTCSEAESACVMDDGEFCDGVDFVCGTGLTCTDNTCS